MTTGQSLLEKIHPKHLDDDPRIQERAPEILARVRAADVDPMTPAEPEAPAAKEDPRNEEVYTFQLDFEDRRGKHWRGEFASKILSIAEQQAMGVLRAQYQCGLELASLDAYTGTLNMQLAHLRFALVKRPKWADNLLELTDWEVIDAIYQKVKDHEHFFRRWPAPEAKG